MTPTPDPAFSDAPLDQAACQTVGQMHDLQGIAPTSHNSGDLSWVGPVDHGSMPGEHNSAEVFGGGYGPQ